jgi:hypothetical protein
MNDETRWFDRPPKLGDEVKVRRRLVTALGILIAACQPSSASGSKEGSVCVLPYLRPADMPRRSGDPKAPDPAESYSIRLDNGRWLALSTQKATLLTGIPQDGRHRVAIRGDGRPYAAFSFTFAELKATDLCLWQNDLYQTWNLWASRDSFKACRCGDVAPAHWTAEAR